MPWLKLERFNHCYSQPVCTSSRVKIMTGRDGIRNYVQFGTLDKDEITFAHMMKAAGYATAVVGKWQLHNGNRGTTAPESGFDNYCLWNYPGTTRSILAPQFGAGWKNNGNNKKRITVRIFSLTI